LKFKIIIIILNCSYYFIPQFDL